MEKVVLCADDYAISPGVSRGIVELAAAGRISATSAMTVAPRWPELARDLDPVRDRIGVGLHLTVTGRIPPLGSLPSLAPEGAFRPLGRLVRTALAGRLAEAEVAAEIDRQLDAFSAAMGGPPDFVDGHQHVHALPGIRGSLMAALTKRGWAGKVWVRDPADRAGAILSRRGAWPKALVVAALSQGFGHAVRRAGFATNRGFSGFSAFDPTADTRAEFERFLVAPGPAHLVMCHPGHLAAGESLDEVVETRERERAFLASDDFAALLERRGVELVKAPL